MSIIDLSTPPQGQEASVSHPSSHHGPTALTPPSATSKATANHGHNHPGSVRARIHTHTRTEHAIADSRTWEGCLTGSRTGKINGFFQGSQRPRGRSGGNCAILGPGSLPLCHETPGSALHGGTEMLDRVSLCMTRSLIRSCTCRSGQHYSRDRFAAEM